MKGIAHWFKSSSKLKRWMLLIIIGILFTCYGIAKILVMKEMSFIEVGRIVVIFTVGFIAIVLGLICINKRTMEMIIESTDDRMQNKKNVNINSLIFNKTVYDKGPNVVAIGGGTGLDIVLAGMKKYTNNITAIVNISNYGEKMSDSRRELNTLPLGDIKESLIALTPNHEEMAKLFNYEFKTGKLKGLDFLDIFFVAMKEVNGNYADAIMKTNEVLSIVGKVLPVTLDEMKIVAELANGYMVEEKSRIPEVVSDKFTKINRVTLSPSNCRPAPGVVEAIKNADCIVIGPGSLYTNVIPSLLVNGVAKAIKESPAIKVYVSNIMTEPGQTDDYSVSDHLNAIVDHCGQGVVDYCIYDTGEIIPEFIKKYNIEGQDLVEQNIEKAKGITFLQRNLSMIIKGTHIRHDPDLVASSIIELICDDLKYQDKENDPQYLMLNTKLREEKRINKVKKEMKKRDVKKAKDPKSANIPKGKSKFSDKYSDRIASIKESDEKVKIKIEKEAQKNKKKIQKDIEKKVKGTQTNKIKEEQTKKEQPIRKSARGLKKKTS